MGAEEKAARDQKKRKLKQSSRGGINSDYSAGELESLINDAPAVGESTAASRAANRTLAFGMALAAGLLFGTCFNPPQHIVDQTKEQFCAKVRVQCVCNVPRAMHDASVHDPAGEGERALFFFFFPFFSLFPPGASPPGARGSASERVQTPNARVGACVCGVLCLCCPPHPGLIPPVLAFRHRLPDTALTEQQLNNIDNATIAEAGCKSIMRNCDYLNTVLLANKSHPATLDCDEMADWHGRLYVPTAVPTAVPTSPAPSYHPLQVASSPRFWG